VTALPLSYLCGWLSWHYIEQPTLSLRRYLRRRKPRPKASRPSAASRLRRLSQPAPSSPPSPPEREASVPVASA
ncbi:MAG: hypothetical protein ACRDSG_12740, partial [Pseudonocardiaceae bacterium]